MALIVSAFTSAAGLGTTVSYLAVKGASNNRNLVLESTLKATFGAQPIFGHTIVNAQGQQVGREVVIPDGFNGRIVGFAYNPNLVQANELGRLIREAYRESNVADVTIA